MTEEELSKNALTKELAHCGNLFHVWQWSLASSSNYSALLDSNRIIVSKSGIDKEFMTPHDFMLVDIEAKPVPPFEKFKPSAEAFLHTQIYKKPTLFNALAVLHTHSKFSVYFSRRYIKEGALSISGFEMQKIFDGINTHESTIEIPVFSNSQKMEDIMQQFEKYLSAKGAPVAYLIEGHGIYTWAKTVLHAKQKLEAIEHLFEIKYMEELNAN